MTERLDMLLTWAPYLLGGFGVNILLAVVATMIGTILGAGFAMLRFSNKRPLVTIADLTSSFFRNVPTLVLLFYLATLIPNEISLAEGLVIGIPAWIKAALALAASPLGFTSWNLHASMVLWRAGKRRAALVFIPNWLNGFLITLLASSTSSLVGVSELVGRSNIVIAATGSRQTLFVYLFASLCFVIFCALFSWLINRIKAGLMVRYS